jgi:hypothetical protein
MPNADALTANNPAAIVPHECAMIETFLTAQRSVSRAIFSALPPHLQTELQRNYARFDKMYFPYYVSC